MINGNKPAIVLNFSRPICPDSSLCPCVFKEKGILFFQVQKRAPVDQSSYDLFQRKDKKIISQFYGLLQGRRAEGQRVTCLYRLLSQVLRCHILGYYALNHTTPQTLTNNNWH
jgi:hypothetical protein